MRSQWKVNREHSTFELTRVGDDGKKNLVSLPAHRVEGHLCGGDVFEPIGLTAGTSWKLCGKCAAVVS